MNLRQIMDTSVRRFKKYTPEILIIEGGIFLMFVFGSCVYQVETVLDSACGNEVAYKSVSPDRKLKAVVFNRDCGATTSYSGQISIIKADEQLPNKIGNIFVADNYAEWVTATWKGNNNLEIDGTRGMDISKQEDEFAFGTVQIHYK